MQKHSVTGPRKAAFNIRAGRQGSEDLRNGRGPNKIPRKVTWNRGYMMSLPTVILFIGAGYAGGGINGALIGLAVLGDLEL